uniref:RNA helicase n=1 Tax=Eptatretus burgeri TaxID=7764 RepID=A0A8C4QX51_EPTBU
MARRRKHFNHAGRVQNKTEVLEEDKETLNIEIEMDGFDLKGLDESNQLVLPSRAPRRRPVCASPPRPPILSRHRRKLLQKVLDRKCKKSERVKLLEKLASCQIPPEEFQLLHSTSSLGSVQTRTKLPEIVVEKHINGVRGKDKPAQRSKRTTKESCAKQSRKSIQEKEQSEVKQDTQYSESEDSEEEEEEEEDEDDDELEEDDEREVKEEKTDEKMISPENCSNLGTLQPCDLDDQGTVKVVAVPARVGETTTVPVKVKTTTIGAPPMAETTVSTPAQFVPIFRIPEIEASRALLPVVAEEQVIMEAVRENPMLVLCGETGSGKTTQVPQFLYESGLAREGIIGVTEPRRIAAMAMSHRVAKEMNLSTRVVSYQVRYEGNVTPETKVKFMTDGILLQEVKKSFLLNSYRVIIIDEAHERSMHTDILIGLLSRIVPLRHKKGRPLTLIIMSATLRVEDFVENARLFPSPPPVVQVDSRQFPVTVHFNRRTPDDYISEAFRKVCKIHKLLPPGGILVFLAGRAEVLALCQRLRRAFPSQSTKFDMTREHGKKTADQRGTKRQRKSGNNARTTLSTLPRVDLSDYPVLPKSEGKQEACELDGDCEVEETSDFELLDDVDLEAEDSCQPLSVLPLYAKLSAREQAKVFVPPPAGSRLCIVSTNVAETALTLPGLRYVLDAGMVRRPSSNPITGVPSLPICRVSQAEAAQRAGRAGRTHPGHCYRLYSSAVFSELPRYPPPEISRSPVDGLVLQLKDLGIDKVDHFPFPTSPSADALKEAEVLLLALGALEAPPEQQKLEKAHDRPISKLGRRMAALPVSPRYAKMLIQAATCGPDGHCAEGVEQKKAAEMVQLIICIVAALSVREIFEETIEAEGKAKAARIRQMKRLWGRDGPEGLLGDLKVLLGAVGACEVANWTTTFCQTNGLRYRAMREVQKLCRQLTKAVVDVFPDLPSPPPLLPPSLPVLNCLRKIVLTGMGSRIARLGPPPDDEAQSIQSNQKHPYQSAEMEHSLYIHPTSILYRSAPQYIIYQELIETSLPYMKGVTAIEPEWIPEMLPHLCTFGLPLASPAPRFCLQSGRVKCWRSGTFSHWAWELPPVEMDHPVDVQLLRHFARFLLEGEVFPALARFRSDLLSTPSIMLKPWARLQPRTEAILQDLAAVGANSRESLQDVWKVQPQVLRESYKQWLPVHLHPAVHGIWPPLA